MLPFRTDVGRVAAHVPEPLARINPDGRVQWRNDRFRELIEGGGPTRLGRPLRELADVGDRTVVDAAVTAMADGASSVDAPVRVRRADGTCADGVVRFLRTAAFEDHEPFVTVLVKFD